MSQPMHSIHLSLVSHTNIGKTALARTLLSQDVGEVRDAPHVTEIADGHTLLQTAQGDRLQLWDTPGFGDSTRLLRRLRQSDNPLGWFMSQVWDRWRDRPFWASQQALRHVVDQADVMLYLVSAAEAPAAAGYVASEMALLEWVGKPVIVLLNQMGAPREAAAEAGEIDGWRQHLAAFAQVRQVLPMDAFARCWVQEVVLLRAVQDCMAGERRDAMGRLIAQWQAQRLVTYDASVEVLASSMGRLASARQELADVSALKSRLRALGSALGIGSSEQSPMALAQAALAAQLDAQLRDGAGTDPRTPGRALPTAPAHGRKQGRVAGRCADGCVGRPEGRHRQRWADLGWRCPGGRPARRVGWCRPGALCEPGARHEFVVAVLECRSAGRNARSRVAALSGGGAFRPRPR
jgi:50S ribosome-binding GTPase